MKLARMGMICGILVALLLASGGMASAHGTAPLRSTTIRIGPYPLRIDYYSEPKGGQVLEFTISVEGGAALGSGSYSVMAVPGPTVSAVPVRATLGPDVDQPGRVQGLVSLPVSGHWLLNIDVAGPQGSFSGSAPVLAGAPPAIPVWAGWLVGLLPVIATVGVVIWQARRRLEGPLWIPQNQPS